MSARILWLAPILIAGCSAGSTATTPETEPNCRVPIDPNVSVGVSVGSGGTNVGGGVSFDVSGNNGVLDADGNCILVETGSKVRIGIGF